MSEPSPSRVLNCIPSRDIERDWRFEHAKRGGILAAARPAELPKEVDLREGWWPVADQGSTGSCVGWASGDSVIRWHMTKAGLIDQDDRISVRYLWMAS